jgi:hypothetical protein
MACLFEAPLFWIEAGEGAIAPSLRFLAIRVPIPR